MCDAQIGVINFSEAGNAFAFGHPSVDSVIDRYLAKPPSSSASVHSNAVKEFEGKYNEAFPNLTTYGPSWQDQESIPVISGQAHEGLKPTNL
ncbi:hypothetical protein F0562_035496 [Nyssa sinensis]|uniref:MADS-box domain-containing protein n=1 Tax=Nyssa sinensis TaxID=561372 RepID=A0A5J5ABF5_9ASTE|nr:hypothetical protein F0562_035496 [Nyssa sinensis]